MSLTIASAFIPALEGLQLVHGLLAVQLVEQIFEHLRVEGDGVIVREREIIITIVCVFLAFLDRRALFFDVVAAFTLLGQQSVDPSLNFLWSERER